MEKLTGLPTDALLKSKDLPAVHGQNDNNTVGSNDASPTPGPSGLCNEEAPPYTTLYSGMQTSSLSSSSVMLDTSGGRCTAPYTAAVSASHECLADKLDNYPYSPLPVTDTSSLQLPVYGSKSNISDTASAIVPICRICHQPGDEYDILISPCRCDGTLKFIHNTCLMKWLEIMSKRSRKPPKCELCHYQYHRHKKFKLDHWRFPRVSQQDKVLHCVFIVNLILMIGCAIATVMCFLSDKGQIAKFQQGAKHNKATLTTEEIVTLSCGVLFFVSFFIAMSVQIKARRTLYQLFVKFIMQNMEWEIDQYDRSKDALYTNKDLLKSFV